MAGLNIDRFFGLDSGSSNVQNTWANFSSQSNVQRQPPSRNSLANFVGQNSLANYIGPNADPFRMELKEPSPAPQRRQRNARRPRNNVNPGSMNIGVVNQSNASSSNNIDFHSMKVKELKDLLKAHGLKQSGRKSDLIMRCYEFGLDLIIPMSVAALREQLRAYEMAVTGTKNELRARLVRARKGGRATSSCNGAGSGRRTSSRRVSGNAGSSGKTGIGSMVINIH